MARWPAVQPRFIGLWLGGKDGASTSRMGSPSRVDGGVHNQAPAACLTGLVVLLVALGPAAAEKRVALVMGNSAYQHTAPLKNPSNDATDMAEKLRQLGFDVIEGTDLSKDEMEQRIRAFADKLTGADVGLFFYAGHGLRDRARPCTHRQGRR